MPSIPKTRRRVPGPKRVRGGSFGQDEPLTNREREVLGLFAEGLGTGEVAGRLSISRVTVRNYAQRIASSRSLARTTTT